MIGNGTTGANKDGFHLRNVNVTRDLAVTRFGDFRRVQPGEPDPRAGKPLKVRRGIEVGHIFKLGTKFSVKFGAVYTDDQKQSHPMVMGCYGIGISRTLQAVIEQGHDADGVVWPWPVAPFQVLVCVLDPDLPESMDLARKLAAAAERAGADVLVDDRAERPGVKFKDADLIGIPLRVTVGSRGLKDGVIEMKWRTPGSEAAKIPLAEAEAPDRRRRGRSFGRKTVIPCRLGELKDTLPAGKERGDRAEDAGSLAGRRAQRSREPDVVRRARVLKGSSGFRRKTPRASTCWRCMSAAGPWSGAGSGKRPRPMRSPCSNGISRPSSNLMKAPERRIEVKLSLPVVAPLLDVIKGLADDLRRTPALPHAAPASEAEFSDVWAGELLAARNRDVNVLLSLFDEDFFSEGKVYFDSDNAEDHRLRSCTAVRLCLRERFLASVSDEALESGDIKTARLDAPTRQGLPVLPLPGHDPGTHHPAAGGPGDAGLSSVLRQVRQSSWSLSFVQCLEGLDIGSPPDS